MRQQARNLGSLSWLMFLLAVGCSGNPAQTPPAEVPSSPSARTETASSANDQVSHLPAETRQAPAEAPLAPAETPQASLSAPDKTEPGTTVTGTTVTGTTVTGTEQPGKTETEPIETGTEDSALAIFRRRITPILQAKNPSSCSECHLSGVDLKDYIHEDQATTFAALRDAGLIDVKNPDGSKLLKFISRKPDKPSLISEKVRQQEFIAFRAWIRAASKDPALAAAKTSDVSLGSKLSDEVIRHARTDRVLASFLDNIWNEVGRCAACHSPDRNQKQVKKHGAQVSWITLGDPQATLDYMLDQGLIDLDDPSESLLLLKPTMQVEHGGGVKMTIGDRSYKQFRRFLDDYATLVSGGYTKAEQLPAANDEVSNTTDIWFKLTGIPAEFDKLTLQVDIYRWDDKANGWSPDRWATADRQVFGKGQLWQYSLILTASRDSDRGTRLRSGKLKKLPPGRYLAKLYLDRQGNLEKKYPYTLGEAEQVGSIELETRWPAGYGAMTTAKYPQK